MPKILGTAAMDRVDKSTFIHRSKKETKGWLNFSWQDT